MRGLGDSTAIPAAYCERGTSPHPAMKFPSLNNARPTFPIIYACMAQVNETCFEVRYLVPNVEQPFSITRVSELHNTPSISRNNSEPSGGTVHQLTSLINPKNDLPNACCGEQTRYPSHLPP